ncbi:YqeG family HAD IIIA-type phosphatase [Aceticella autotrophica]|uniref:YqeG family HAD IIIA-type phosphatase n=1 Tax=Aceticella autotrophica TaxID=2755338 RepID=A0A975AUB5_9THEO|nr:YqeG family HAD IIIA-type phosphatase [Aceticella autotrophica]QSZ26536.1 YqeG family HAD IIIA-type phosphatase [Aceticella autotrophica]
MYHKLIPDMRVKNIYEINFDSLKKMGIQYLIIDIDNTLVPQKVRYVDNKILEWFKNINENGFKVCLISNNTKKRVNGFKEKIGVPGIAWAIKPRKSPFKKALKILNAKPSETAVIGDQIFTDIFGGHRAGLYTILVVPISKEEFGLTKIVRKFEKHILKRM